jgi:hypothetical protein
MPNGKVHREWGGMTGVVCGAVAVSHDPSFYALAGWIGGGVGGVVGGSLPDLIDVPCHPNHRSLAHGVLPVGTAVIKTVAWWKRQIDECNRRAKVAEERWRQMGSTGFNWERAGWLFLAGLMAGFVGGYVSHLVLDSSSKKSLPLL